MRIFATGLGLAAALTMAVAGPNVAQARSHYRHYASSCEANRHHHAVAGTIIGAVTGGIIGNAIGHGRAGGTIIGAGVGAVAGHQIGKSSHRC